MIKKFLLTVAILNSYLFAGEVNIAVAANISYVIEKIKEEFKKTNPDTKVQVTIGSSGKLTAQIKNGAPFNIFMSADMNFPQSLYEEKIAITKPMIYAQGALALFSPKKLDLGKGINLLLDENISKIAIANPKTAPYGIATMEAIKNANLEEKVRNKFVFGESISQTVAYTTTAADIGFIAKSSLYDEKMKDYKENIDWITVNPTLYTSINQGIVIIKNAKENSEVKAFYDFILSSKAKDIFEKYGYIVK